MKRSGLSCKRLAFVQYGDHLEAVERFRVGGEETYYAQRYSVEFIEELPKQHDGVLVVSLRRSDGQGQSLICHEQQLESGVHCSRYHGDIWKRSESLKLYDYLARWGTTHLILRTPNLGLLRFALKHRWDVLPVLADSFRRGRIQAMWKQFRLKRTLNHEQIRCVGNHQLMSCRDLVRIGVDPAKVIPWDWPSRKGPTDFPVKSMVAQPGHLSIAYAGSIQEAKGCDEVFSAVASLQKSGLDVTLRLAGQGPIDRYRSLSEQLGIGRSVDFLGRIPHQDVLTLMHESDAVVVPSHHAYPEGLPMTIIDALTTRTPIVASDHPMFLNCIQQDHTGLIFPEKQSHRLAEQLRRLHDDPQLYHVLSRNSELAWQSLRLPVMWGDLIDRWLSDRQEDHDWLANFSLAAHDYSY